MPANVIGTIIDKFRKILKSKLTSAVIPAQAGIQTRHVKPAVLLDSRFRGNDGEI